MSEQEFKVVAQSWVCEKPNEPKREDGWSIHLSEEDRVRYVRRFIAGLHKGDDGFSRPEGEGQDSLVKKSIFDELEEVTRRRGLFGLRFYTYHVRDLRAPQPPREYSSRNWSGFDGFHDF